MTSSGTGSRGTASGGTAWRVMRAMLVLSVAAVGLVGVPAPAGAQTGSVEPSGVLITDDELVLPVRQVRTDGYRVETTCSSEAVLSNGTYVPAVDVVLDPGHGGSESGAAGSNGLLEKDLNLAVAIRVRDDLIARGYTVLLTRTTDVRIPLRVRASIANALSPDAFVSIHHNGGAVRRSSDPGTETYHQVANPDSIRLAGILYEEIHAAMSAYDVAWVDTVNQGANARTRNDGTDLFGVLRRTPTLASVITEAAWLSNPAEARLLADPAVQAAEAAAIADGIVRYLTTTDPGSGFNGAHADESTSGTGGVDGCVDPFFEDWSLFTTVYDDAEWASVSNAAASIGVDTGYFQKFAVYLVAFVRGLGGETDPVELAETERPTNTGTTWTTSGWSPSERVVLADMADVYDLSVQEMQKLAALAFAFVLSL